MHSSLVCLSVGVCQIRVIYSFFLQWNSLRWFFWVLYLNKNLFLYVFPWFYGSVVVLIKKLYEIRLKMIAFERFLVFCHVLRSFAWFLVVMAFFLFECFTKNNKLKIIFDHIQDLEMAGSPNL